MYNISYIAKSVLADIDSVDNREYQRIVKFAIDGYRKLRLSGLMGKQIKQLNFKSTQTTLHIYRMIMWILLR